MSISIITICKNSEKNIEKTILSVLSQRDIDFEYIIIDGMSDDNTLEIISTIVKNNPKVIVRSERDSGISDAMNKGAAIASGKLLFFLHSGDCLYGDNKLSQVYDSYQKFKWSWASGVLLLSRNGRILSNASYSPGKIAWLKYKNCIPHQSTFITSELFKKAGGFNVKLNQAMDYDLWMRLKYLYCIHNFKLNFEVAIFDVDGVSSKIIPLVLGNIKVQNLIRQKNKSVTWFDTCILIFGIISYWLISRIKLFFYSNK